MKTKKNTRHRGEMLKEAVADSGMSVTALTKKVHYSRSTYYNHINDPELPLQVIEKYGRVLKHDFSDELPQINSLRLEEEEFEYGRPDTFEKALQRYDYFKAKYIATMEKYNALLERLNTEGKNTD